LEEFEVDEPSTSVAARCQESSSEEERELQGEEGSESRDTVVLSVDKIEVGDFVHVVLTYDKNTRKETEKHFAAQVKKIEGNILTLNFMRKSCKMDNIYIFPSVADESDVTIENIIAVLQPNFIKRGRYCFSSI
jgi:hypothetical protein